MNQHGHPNESSDHDARKVPQPFLPPFWAYEYTKDDVSSSCTSSISSGMLSTFWRVRNRGARSVLYRDSGENESEISTRSEVVIVTYGGRRHKPQGFLFESRWGGPEINGPIRVRSRTRGKMRSELLGLQLKFEISKALTGTTRGEQLGQNQQTRKRGQQGWIWSTY